jgi:hypothetical protein
MGPNVGVGANDPLARMFDFLAFGEAVENGLNPAALIEAQVAQGRAHLDNRITEVSAQLRQLIDAEAKEYNQFVEQARALAPRDAQVYAGQLSQRLQELQEAEAKKKREFDLAERVTREQNSQIAGLIASVENMRKIVERQPKHAYFQRQMLPIGNQISQSISEKR